MGRFININRLAWHNNAAVAYASFLSVRISCGERTTLDGHLAATAEDTYTSLDLKCTVVDDNDVLPCRIDSAGNRISAIVCLIRHLSLEGTAVDGDGVRILAQSSVRLIIRVHPLITVCQDDSIVGRSERTTINCDG